MSRSETENRSHEPVVNSSLQKNVHCVHACYICMHIIYHGYVYDVHTCMHAMYNEHAFDVCNTGHRHLIGMCDVTCDVWVQDNVSYHLVRTWLASMFVC